MHCYLRITALNDNTLLITKSLGALYSTLHCVPDERYKQKLLVCTLCYHRSSTLLQSLSTAIDVWLKQKTLLTTYWTATNVAYVGKLFLYINHYWPTIVDSVNVPQSSHIRLCFFGCLEFFVTTISYSLSHLTPRKCRKRDTCGLELRTVRGGGFNGPPCRSFRP